MDNMREEVISNLRACLISTKGKCDLRTLRKDYQMLMGEQIPYVKLGYKTLEDFICSVDTLATSRAPTGELLVDAVSTQQTKHITDMINKQKSSKKKRVSTKPIKQVSFSHNQTPSSKWRPKNITVKISSGYNSSPRPAAMSHNQFVNHPKSPQKYMTPPRYAKITNQTITQNTRLTANSNNSNGSTSNSNNKSNNTSTAAVVVSENNKTSDNKCTALTNTKMRIMKKMNEISLDSDGGDKQISNSSSPNWSPNREMQKWNSNGKTGSFSSDETPVNNVFELTGNSLVDLENFIRFRNLPQMTIKMVERKTNKGRVVLHDCNIKVSNHSYSNYPTEFVDPELSKQCTAKIALDDLMKKYGRRKSLLLSTEKDILERIPPMVEKHTNGIWNTQLEADYSDMYNEQLPSNWIEVVDISQNVYVEPVLDKFILRYCQPGEVFQKGNRSYNPLVTDVSVPSNTVHFSENGELTAVITCAVSAGEIWCRQIATPESEAFERMLTRLELIYNAQGKSLKAENVKEGGYFIVKSDDSWLRVRVLDVKDKEVNCFCIDTGDELTVIRDQVYQLKREFAVEQAQVFVCRLAGLEELYECSKNSENISNLAGKAVVLEMHADENSKTDPTDPSFPVVMYDIETQKYINQEMIDLISFEAAAPVLKKDITEVYISHVENNGDIYVQVHSSGFEQLKQLLENLKNANLKFPIQYSAQITSENSKNRLYFLKKQHEDDWYRIKFLDWAPTGQFAQIHYVDYGNCDIITVKNEILFPIDEISDIASHYPYQALKVRMAVDKVPENFVEKFKRLIPPDTGVLLKNFGRNNDIHIVDFFKRSEADNVLFSITSAIEMESQRDGDGNNNNNNHASRATKLQRLMSLNNLPSAGLLKPPPIPSKGEYFDVMVPCAVNPYNFFVQPYESNEKLDRLMSALQEKYKQPLYSPPQIEDIQPGKIYASKHVDNLWYRTSVIKVIHAGSISVFYCDFGYYANLTQQQLIPLDPEFTELPYQAIKARLVGIKPKQSKWTMEDCQFFQNLVCKKPFVSVLVAKEKDELYRSDMVLNLKLIDTATDQDIYIHRILVEEGIAAEC